MTKLKNRLKIPLRRALAALLVLVLLPFSAAALAKGADKADPTQEDRSPGDIGSEYVDVNDESDVRVLDQGGNLIHPTGEDGKESYSDVPAGSTIHIHYGFSLKGNNGKTESEDGKARTAMRSIIILTRTPIRSSFRRA